MPDSAAPIVGTAISRANSPAAGISSRQNKKRPDGTLDNLIMTVIMDAEREPQQAVGPIKGL